MQFSVVTLFAVMAAVATAEKTVTVYACGPSSTAVAPSGYAAPTIAPTGTGVVVTPTATGIPYTGGAAANGVSAAALIVAGGVALFL